MTSENDREIFSELVDILTMRQEAGGKLTADQEEQVTIRLAEIGIARGLVKYEADYGNGFEPLPAESFRRLCEHFGAKSTIDQLNDGQSIVFMGITYRKVSAD